MHGHSSEGVEPAEKGALYIARRLSTRFTLFFTSSVLLPFKFLYQCTAEHNIPTFQLYFQNKTRNKRT